MWNLKNSKDTHKIAVQTPSNGRNEYQVDNVSLDGHQRALT